MTSYNRGGVVVVAVLALSARLIFASTEHNVGSGCDYPLWNPDSTCNFNAWAQTQVFLVGDSLVFTYTEGESDVALVTKEAYGACKNMGETPTTAYAVDTTSPTTVNLSIAGTFYFVSTINSACSFTHLQLTITVKEASSPGADEANQSTNSSYKPAGSSPSTASSSSSHHSSIVGPVVGGTIGFVFLAAKLTLLGYCVQRRRRQKRIQDALDCQANGFGSGPVFVNNHVVMHVEENHIHNGAPVKNVHGKP